uniref:Uncharacterized protein n=1 Tax=Meloidogyne incognita TaxID=6306 RepID=A0A914L2P4_MELIC
MLIYNLHFVLLILIVPIFRSCSAIPRRGLEPWSIILCKFRDLATYEPRTKNWFIQWITGHNDEPDTIEQYFMNVSNGLYSIAGSNVNGWFTLSKTQKDILRMVNKSRRGRISPPLLGSDSSFRYFDVIKDLCFAEAVKNGSSLHRQKITIINAGTAAVFDKKNGVLLTPQLVFSSVLTHEMVFPYASSGEYDDRYDLMSTANAYMYHSNFGMSGPGLNGPHLDYLGWLPMDRMLYFGRTRGWLLIMLPYDRDDPNNYYTIELRTPHNFDRGIEQPSVLVHRVQKNGISYYSTLLRQADFYELTDEGTEWVTFLELMSPTTSDSITNKGKQNSSSRNFQFIRVSLKKVYEYDADIHIISTFNPTECHFGEQKFYSSRQSHPLLVGLDHICLGATMSKNNNSTADNNEFITERSKRDEQLRLVRLFNGGDFKKQFGRQNFFSNRKTFGANSCRKGFVWRSLDSYDYICVTEQRQKLAQRENLLQENRISYNGHAIRCIEPFLPRRAFPGDEICVLAEEKFHIFRENSQACFYQQILHINFLFRHIARCFMLISLMGLIQSVHNH